MGKNIHMINSKQQLFNIIANKLTVYWNGKEAIQPIKLDENQMVTYMKQKEKIQVNYFEFCKKTRLKQIFK